MRKSNKSERGQAMLEAALTTLAFLFLLIGIIDVGQVLYVHQSIVERVRAAIRYGVVHDFDADAIKYMVVYNSPTSPVADGEELPSGFLGLTVDNVDVTRDDATFNEDRLTVSVSDYTFSLLTPLVLGQYYGKPITASMPYEGL